MAEDYLLHVGVSKMDGAPIGSGRYPLGSGEMPYQHEASFMNSYRKLHDQGFSDNEIASMWGMSTTEFRARRTFERNADKNAEIAYIMKLTDEGYSNVAIGEKIGKDESYVRYQKREIVKERNAVTSNVADILKENVDNKTYIDIGLGTANYLGVSDQRLDAAVRKLQDEGYEVYTYQIPQATNPDQHTTMKVLCKPGVTWNEARMNRENTGFVTDFYSLDGGKTFLGIEQPTSIDSSRLAIKYAEDGGTDMDGVILLRRGVEDISLGGAKYAQVRIAVDGTHYLKGMALYSDDLPEGVDILFNTNKSKDVPALGPKGNTVLKPLKSDPNNPFGTTLRMEEGVIVGQRHYIDEDGKSKLSPINIVREEGDWNTWSNTLSSQFLAKQPNVLIKQQLNKSLDEKREEFNDINKITQPEVKEKLLYSFAEDCDASASHLKAAALPRQANKVILPLPDLKDDEVYAPTFRDGELLALVRHPHAGPFEIPILKNNTHSTSGKKTIGQAIDAIGINPKVAQILSGADFDGDTVLCIPTAGQKIVNKKPLDGLKNFDPKEAYKKVDGMTVMTKKNTQIEMGKISNLITDMTLKGASDEELAAAVRHSMVVIDAEKHQLNYKLSEKVNNIAALKTKYQGGPRKGASTLISLADKDIRVKTRKETIDPKTGKILKDEEAVKNKYHDKKTVLKDGTISYTKVRNTKTSTPMRETDNAFTLSSGTDKEDIYANYANALKAMANNARKEAISVKPTKYSPSAKESYSKEVSSLNAKLNIALKNKPKERKAQILANVLISAQKRSNPDMTKEEITKFSTQALVGARNKTGASRRDSTIDISKSEWDAISSGAVSSSKIKAILDNANSDQIKQYAMPRASRDLTDAQIARIHALNNSGATYSEIADALGVSTTTVSKHLT